MDDLMQPTDGSRPIDLPNFVIIVADDLGYGDISCYGCQTAHTPNIDKLAAEGTRFTDFHVTAPVCSPSRAGLLTGRYPQRAGIPGVLFANPAKGTYDDGLYQHEVTFSKLLQQAGYQTGIVGKWHLGHHPCFNPVNHGFDTFWGYMHGNVDYITHMTAMGKPDWWHGTELVEEEGYTTHLITKHALEFMAANRERPFCLYIAHEAVHAPYQDPESEPVRMKDGRILPGRKDKKRVYKAMTEIMDDSVGAVMAAIKGLGIADRTLVFFISDNGAITDVGSNAPLRGGKSTLWEGGHRVPAIAWWPGRIASARVSNEFVTACDMAPTLLTLSRTSLPGRHYLDGIDISSVLFSDQPCDTRVWFWQSHETYAMRAGQWKLVNDPRLGPCLFNLAEDLAEEHNLADAYPQRVATMLYAIERWKCEVNEGATLQPSQAVG